MMTRSGRSPDLRRTASCSILSGESRDYIEEVNATGMRRIARFGAANALLLSVVLGIACGGKQSPQAAAPRLEKPNGAAGGGVISFGPNITETIFALGQGARLVGVTSFCDYPPEVAQIEKVGGAMNPNKEKITMLAPELIILQGRIQPVADLAANIGARVLSVDMDTLARIDEGIETIGRALGCEQEAAALRHRMKVGLDSVRDAVKDQPRPKVLIITGRTTHDLNTLFTAGGLSFLSELIDIAGGENVFKDTAKNYFEASKETVLARAPDVILEFHPGEKLSEQEQAAFIRDWDRLGPLPAVQNGRVHIILESDALRPGPRIAGTARLLATRLHPNVTIPMP